MKNSLDDEKILSACMGKLVNETDRKTILVGGRYVSDDVRKGCEKEGVEFIATAIPIRGKEN